MPLEDAVYYFYDYQPNTLAEGNNGSPSIVARVLADDTTQLSRYEYNNPFLKLTKSTDPKGRVTSYQYAENGVDLIAVFQRNPSGQSQDPDGFAADEIFGCTYTDTESHLPHVVTDPAGQTTTYTYTASKQPETVTNADGISTYAYGDGSSLEKPIGYLTSITSPEVNGSSAVRSFRYDSAHRVQTVTTSPDGYSLTIQYDALDRPTQITYPDATTEQFAYTDSVRGMTLDLTESKDRLDRWTHRHYNADRQMDSIIDPAGRTTSYGWCTCGSLLNIKDPKHNVTAFIRDLQSRVTSKVFAANDGEYTSTITYSYETGTSRLSSMTDALNQTTNYQYNVDDNLAQVSYSNALNPTPTVDYSYDNYYNRIASITAASIGMTKYNYYRAGHLGAGRVETIGGIFPNDYVTYTYDELGRVLSQSIGGVAETVAYDELGRLTTTDNSVLGHFDREYYGPTPRLKRLDYPNSQRTKYTYFPNTHDFRLQTIQNLTGVTNLSQFDYTYDPEGQIMSWSRLLDTKASGLWFDYDDARQLRSARNAEVVNAATKKLDYDYDDAGNRTYDRNYNPNGLPLNGVSNSYAINVLNQVESRTVGTSLEAQTFSYDAVGNLTYDGDGKTFEWDAANRLIAINYIAGGNRTEFAYDGLGRRVKITEYGTGMTGEVEPADTDYTSFVAGKFTLRSGDWILTLQGLNPAGGDNTMLVDSVTFDSVPISNGSFELPIVDDYQVAPTGAGWSFSGTAGIAKDGGTYASGNPPPDGTQVAFVRNYGSLSQNLSIPAGTYKLRLNAAQRGGHANESVQRLRVSLRSSASVISAKTFVWCGNEICEERDATGANVTKRFFVEGEQQIIGNFGPVSYYYTRDHLGSIREVTDSAGGVVARYDYDPYGNRVVLSGQMVADFGYTGHYHHAPSGLNLTLYRAYNPQPGRWLSRDPIGEAGGINLYGYVGNDPVSMVDPLGLLDRVYTETDVQNIFLGPAYDQATAGRLQGLINIWLNSEGRGPYDFSNEPGYEGDTFCVNGKPLNRWEFGNYIAGYQGAAYDLKYGDTVSALAAVYVAGASYHVRGMSVRADNPSVLDWNPVAGFPMITAGAIDIAILRGQ